MRVTIEIDPNSRDDDNLVHTIRLWLHHSARGKWSTSESENINGLTLLTFDFRDSLDAVDFQGWRDVARHIRRT
jgi:hypothetical protein